MTGRLVILTRGAGKDHRLCQGSADGLGSQLMAAAAAPLYLESFCCMRAATPIPWRVRRWKIISEEIAGDMEAACYGSYFLELADYYGRENIDATETLRLLYQSLRALLKPSVPNRLVKPVYELKLMEINGEYRELPLGRLNDSTLYAWQYVLAAPVESLYTFTLTDQVLGEFVRCVEQNKERFIDRNVPFP